LAESRRRFLAKGTMGVVGAAMAAEAGATRKQTPQTPEAPPAFGTAPPVGPQVSAETLREAEKLVRIEYSEEHLAEAAGNWSQAMAPVYERRTGPRKLPIPYEVPPATVWNPEMLPFGQLPSFPPARFEPSCPNPARCRPKTRTSPSAPWCSSPAGFAHGS